MAEFKNDIVEASCAAVHGLQRQRYLSLSYLYHYAQYRGHYAHFSLGGPLFDVLVMPTQQELQAAYHVAYQIDFSFKLAAVKRPTLGYKPGQITVGRRVRSGALHITEDRRHLAKCRQPMSALRKRLLSNLRMPAVSNVFQQWS